MVQDAAAVYHQRVWRSSIYQDNLYQLTPSEKEVVSFYRYMVGLLIDKVLMTTIMIRHLVSQKDHLACLKV
jgi:hypothetical protein